MIHTLPQVVSYLEQSNWYQALLPDDGNYDVFHATYHYAEGGCWTCSAMNQKSKPMSRSYREQWLVGRHLLPTIIDGLVE